jgi:hypothetical protein
MIGILGVGGHGLDRHIQQMPVVRRRIGDATTKQGSGLDHADRERTMPTTGLVDQPDSGQSAGSATADDRDTGSSR